MDRISTSSAYGSVLLNIMKAQLREQDAGDRVSTQKNATDLKGFASNAETLSALEAVQTKVSGYLDQSAVLTNKLSSQDTALNQVADAADGARQAIANALASGSGDTLMQSLQGFFQNASEGLNTQFDGHYLFSGGQLNTAPVSATTMSQLTSGPPIASFFHNDKYVTSNQLDDTTTIKSGFLADNVGTGLFTDFQSIQAFSQGASGPFSGALTQAQKTFLQGMLSSFQSDHTNVVNVAGQNGLMQNQVDSAKADLGNRQTMVAGLVSNIADADMAKAAADLQQAQISVQAAAQVFQTLRSSSLAALLPIS